MTTSDNASQGATTGTPAHATQFSPGRVIRAGLVSVFAFLWAGGIISYALRGGPPERFAWTAPLFLALAGALVLAITPRRQWVWPGLAAAIGFASEIAGTAFGFPYGHYSYTTALAPKLLGVPLVLTCAWLVLVAMAQSCLAHLRRAARAVLGALWLTATDFLIDPLAAGPLGFWRWDAGGPYFDIPWSNFAGWFLTSLLIFALLPSAWQPDRRARWLGASVIAFFAAIAFALSLHGLGALGIALLLPALLCRRPAATT